MSESHTAKDDCEDLYDEDGEFGLPCIHCCGDGVVENDDPIQRGPSAYLKCFSCGGSGKREDMTVW
jgi:hypothetical protein